MTTMQPASASPLSIDHEKYRDYAERMADAWLQNCRIGSTYLYTRDWDTSTSQPVTNPPTGKMSMFYDQFFLRALYLLYLNLGDEGYKRRIRAYYEDLDTYLRRSNDLFGGGTQVNPLDSGDSNWYVSYPNYGDIIYLDYIYAATWYDDAITKWLDAIIEYHIPQYDDQLAAYQNEYNTNTGVGSGETYYSEQLGVALYFISGYAATGNYTYLRFAKRLVNGVWQARDKSTNLIPDSFESTLDFTAVDPYAYGGSDGLMILTSLLLYESTGDEGYLDRAERCASAILYYGYDATNHYLYKKVSISDGSISDSSAALTERQAYFAKRLVSLYKITDNSTYLTRAEEIESYLAPNTSTFSGDQILAYEWLLLDLYRATKDDTYLTDARDLADWVLENRYDDGFIKSGTTSYAYIWVQAGFIVTFLSLASPVAVSCYPEVAAGVSFTARLTEYPYVFQSPPLLYVNKTYIDGLDYDTDHHTIKVSVASDEKNTTEVIKVDVMALAGTLSVKNVLVEDVYYPSDMWERVDIEGSRFYTAHNVTLHTSSILHTTVEFVYKGYDLKITMLDSKDRPLPDAFVILYIGDTASINGTAGSDGYKKFYDLKETEYTLKVYWKDVFVGAKNVSLTEDMSVTISCAVYDLTIKITYPPWDTPLSNVTVSIQMGNTTFSSLMTGSNGSATSTLPQGNYTVALYWLTYNLENRTVNVNSNKEVKFSVNIYYWYLLVVGKMFYQIAFGNPPMTVTTIVVFFLIIFLLFFRYWRLLLRRERLRRLFPEVMGPPP